MAGPYKLHVQPEPWCIGPVSIGRKNGHSFGRVGPDPTLKAYQEAVRAELLHMNAKMLPDADYELEILVYRQIETYSSAATGRTVVRNQADATNLLKATEDALQGVLISNDRHFRKVSLEIIEQTRDTEPCVFIMILPYKRMLDARLKWYEDNAIEADIGSSGLQDANLNLESRDWF